MPWKLGRTCALSVSSLKYSAESPTSDSTQHELCEVLVIFEHESADRVEVGHVRLAAQHVAHDRSIALEAICLQCRETGKYVYGARVTTRDHSRLDNAYKTVCDHVVLLQHRRGHLRMLVVVMFDEVGIAHASLLSDEYCCFDDLAEACC